MAKLDALFGTPGYFSRTPADQVKSSRAERARLQERVEKLMAEWEALEQEMAGV
jgi:cell division protein FtsB